MQQFRPTVLMNKATSSNTNAEGKFHINSLHFPVHLFSSVWGKLEQRILLVSFGVLEVFETRWVAHHLDLCGDELHVIVVFVSRTMKSQSLVFFVINSFLFLFFSHITQHNIQNITKQNNRHILNISRSNQKGGREGRTIKTQKSLLYTITYIHQKTLPSINGRGPGPTNSRRCTFT